MPARLKLKHFGWRWVRSARVKQTLTPKDFTDTRFIKELEDSGFDTKLFR